MLGLKETDRFKSYSKRKQNIISLLPVMFSGIPLGLLLINYL